MPGDDMKNWDWSKPPLKAVVGSERTPVFVHESALLSLESQFLPSFADDPLESCEKVLDWTQFDFDTIKAVLSFVYTGQYNSDPQDESKSDGEVDADLELIPTPPPSARSVVEIKLPQSAENSIVSTADGPGDVLAVNPDGLSAQDSSSDGSKTTERCYRHRTANELWGTIEGQPIDAEGEVRSKDGIVVARLHRAHLARKRFISRQEACCTGHGILITRVGKQLKYGLQLVDFSQLSHDNDILSGISCPECMKHETGQVKCCLTYPCPCPRSASSLGVGETRYGVDDEHDSKDAMNVVSDAQTNADNDVFEIKLHSKVHSFATCYCSRSLTEVAAKRLRCVIDRADITHSLVTDAVLEAIFSVYSSSAHDVDEDETKQFLVDRLALNLDKLDVMERLVLPGDEMIMKDLVGRVLRRALEAERQLDREKRETPV